VNGDHPIQQASSGDPSLLAMLRRHPRVGSVSESSSRGIEFRVGDWQREVAIADPSRELYGLVEVMDNNPLVCADRISVPGPAATLAMIAFAPLALSGLLADSPVAIFNFETDSSEIDAGLRSVGWRDGAAVHVELMDLGGVLACTVLASIQTPSAPEDLDELYSERYERSFYVLRDESSAWSPELVLGKPHAVYRMAIAVDQPNSLLTIGVLADSDGKCGASQAVHAMNVMCGFEETLGIS